jgi:undecaprenyl-diphosphatase
MWLSTNMLTWIPFAVVLLYVIFKNNKIKEALIIIALLGVVIALADQISSGICKPLFARFRPTQDPELMYQIDIVNGYRGGTYGFISSHAANTFGVAVFLTLIFKSGSLAIILFIWAILNAFSRIYLGVHYPGDILFGTLVGVGAGILIYIIYRKLQNTLLKQANFISNQYTSSGYLISDIRLIKTVFYLTLFYVMVRGMMITLY